jgi:hypothetical protein
MGKILYAILIFYTNIRSIIESRVLKKADSLDLLKKLHQVKFYLKSILYLMIFTVLVFACESTDSEVSNQQNLTLNEMNNNEMSTIDQFVENPNTNDAFMSNAQSDMSLVCHGLFGVPSEQSGLNSDQCSPQCTCGTQIWQSSISDTSHFDRWKSYQLESEQISLDSDPYTTSDLIEIEAVSTQNVCAIVPTQEKRYRLETFESIASAQQANALVTHAGRCGLCSSLKDLMVYIANPDLTDPVRACGVLGLQSDMAEQTDCLLDLGFSEACASIWSYNITHTRMQCLSECLPLLSSPHHEPSGDLNACIQCDEDLSGPVFKYIAGRTRRNSGIPTALCRPCESVFKVKHDYIF